jgi:mono/diheme cytochrome c family protein
MNRLGWFVLGALAILVVEAVAGYVILQSHGVSANAAPSGIEATIARHARQAAIPAKAKSMPNPVGMTPEVLAAARAHWADHCATCHANDGSGDVTIGKHLYPPAPDMRKAETQDLSDGELFYIIQNGVRLTGMPAWGGGSDHDAQDSWKLVHFIRHLPSLTFEERKQMEKLNPKSPDEWKEEEEEDKFLRGDTDEPKQQHHHH